MTTDNRSESAPCGEKRYTAVEQTMQRFDYQEHGLVEVLITAQEEFGYLSKDLLTHVADKLHIPLSQVYGVATFYDMFTLEAAGATHAMVCTGPACFIVGSKDVLAEACEFAGISEPGQTSADGKYSVKEATCLGLCDQAPAVLVNKQAQVNIAIDDVPAMLQGQASSPCIQVSGEPRILTAPIGRLSPTDLDAHRSEGAFTALEKALCTMTPEEIIKEVKDSRLSGRGGAGFQTGIKWQLAREAPGKNKYVVCNFDESEPGTFKDRVLMEGNPFRVLEGMTISACATGAHKGYIFIRGEYPTATDIVEEAVDKLYAGNLLGDDILGSGYSVDIEVQHNAGAYICGEETALFETIEGKRGHPRIKPPFPTQVGLFGKPTVINNVETLAVVPSLILNGGEWFCQWGMGKSIGLKLFCLSGHIKKPGIVEVPLGLTVRELIENFGGGFVGEPQAILVGGAAGGFLHPDELDTPLTHEDLAQLEVPIGSGAIMVFNQSVDLWQVLQALAHFFVHETCGQCAPCRLGTMQIYKLLNKINLGIAKSIDLQRIEDLGGTIKNTCVCGLGMTAANPVLTVLHHFNTTPRV
ncbi:MAG: NADH-quinone oxidoreductase subunit NuoF [Anaerolineaceae bacterium]|nr:MAG: NADH-quinone oxidoreductase subunit NuoF [Anaerolineaceae bacterium]